MNGKKLCILIVLLALLGCGGIGVQLVKGYGEELIEPMTTLLAENLVNSYYPAKGDYATSAYIKDPNWLMHSVRGSFLITQVGKKRYDDCTYCDDVNVYRERYWKLVQQYATPGMLKAVYDMVAPKIVPKVIKIASKPVNDPEHEWRNRPAYSDEQVREMLTFYAKTARDRVYSLEQVLKLSESSKVLQACEKILGTERLAKAAPDNSPEKKKFWEKAYGLEEGFYELCEKFGDVEQSTFTWALRQRIRDPELIKVAIELVEDAARRAEEAAAKL